MSPTFPLDLSVDVFEPVGNWFKHVNRKFHQDHERLFATKDVTKKLPGALTGKAEIKSWIEKMKTFPASIPASATVRCQCTSAPGECDPAMVGAQRQGDLRLVRLPTRG
ncbi:hypothetical protein D9611_014317 [Ephemerocybe angulata]|uniref:Uncharacterized protein n=1 Tax=Ephemerocybe angulata TaxID=980116 RepID=A0A8H5C421_9AGAR|nr:hypothetical protein D9611_014317 [Tulosesus angulatus]